MPLFEYECIQCRKNVEDSLKELQKGITKKKVSDLVKKYDNINHIGVFDLESEEVLAEHGKRDRECVDLDFFLNDGAILVLFNMQKNFRFSELIYEEEDEKKLKCPFCSTKKVEKVVEGVKKTGDNADVLKEQEKETKATALTEAQKLALQKLGGIVR